MSGSKTGAEERTGVTAAPAGNNKLLVSNVDEEQLDQLQTLIKPRASGSISTVS